MHNIFNICDSEVVMYNFSSINRHFNIT